MDVDELIKELEKLPKNLTVKLSVNYDHCDHIQNLKEVYHYNETPWVVLKGGKEWPIYNNSYKRKSLTAKQYSQMQVLTQTWSS